MRRRICVGGCERTPGLVDQQERVDRESGGARIARHDAHRGECGFGGFLESPLALELCGQHRPAGVERWFLLGNDAELTHQFGGVARFDGVCAERFDDAPSGLCVFADARAVLGADETDGFFQEQ